MDLRFTTVPGCQEGIGGVKMWDWETLRRLCKIPGES